MREPGQAHKSTMGKNDHSVQRRRELRQSGTSPEQLLWFRLRNRQIEGKKFRRQHALGPYIVDFYCLEARLVVEIDGDTHGELEQASKDGIRTEYLDERGIRVLRFTNREIMYEREAVLEVIRVALT